MCKLLNEKSLLFAALLLSAISMSCSKEPQDTNSKQSGNNVHEWEDSTLSGDAVMGSAMAFKVGGGMSVERTAQTRATTDINGNATFTEGDFVAVAVTRSGGSEVVKLYRVKNDGSLEYAGGDNDPFVWKSAGESVTIRAWSYGTSTDLSYTLTAPETRDYTLETDQQANDYRELLYCKAADKSYSSGAISLNFYHQLARMVFNVTHESSSPLTISSVSIGSSSFPKMARFNVPTGSSNVGTWVVKSGTGSTGSITPRTETPTTTGYLATYSAVVFPTFTTQNYPKDTPFFTVTSGTNNYTYKIAESAGMAYDGNTQYNYTINVKDDVGVHMNPLYFVAKYFLNSSKTFETNVESGYLWKQKTMMNSKFAAQTTSYNGYKIPTSEHTISSVKYHLPTQQEWYSIIPFTKEIFSSSLSAGLQTEEACVFGADSKSKVARAYKSYWSSYSSGDTRYAIRFLGTNYCSVWRYRYGNNRVEIASVLISPIAEDATSSLSTKMTEIMASSFAWPTEDNDSKGAYYRYFPSLGYQEGGERQGSSNSDGFMCSATSTTSSTDSYGPRYGSYSFKFSMSTASNNNGRPVRLFRDE